MRDFFFNSLMGNICTWSCVVGRHANKGCNCVVARTRSCKGLREGHLREGCNGEHVREGHLREGK